MRTASDDATTVGYAAKPPALTGQRGIAGLPACLMTILLLTQTAPTRLAAQETVTVSGEVTCPDCVITLDTVATLSGPDLQVSFAPGVAMDRRGRFLLTTARPEILVFDSTGTFLRTVGRRGEGPGEYEMLIHIAVGAQYIHAFDAMRGRTVLDHDFQFVRADRFPANYLYAHVIAQEDVVFAGDVLTDASVGYALHILELSGTLTSFDGDGVWRGQSGKALNMVTGDSTSLWVVEPNPNRMTRWDLVPEPRKAVVYNRVVEEFDRHGTDPQDFPGVDNAGARLNEDGLWILWKTPDPNFTPTPGRQMVEEPPQKLRDTWLDLLDPETGHTLARLRSDGSAPDFVDGSPGYFYFYNETDAGEPSVVVVNPRLARGTRMRR